MTPLPDQSAPELPDVGLSVVDRKRRLGSFDGGCKIPDDFDAVWANEVLALLEGRVD